MVSKKIIITTALILAILPLAIFGQDNILTTVRTHYSNDFDAILSEYFELLKLPNVASDGKHMNSLAHHIEQIFEKRGVSIELLRLANKPEIPPLIYGELPAKDSDRTLLLYVHYDGQPVDPDRWTHNPWNPTLYSASIEEGGEPIPFPESSNDVNPDWRIYARSASDDKAPLITILSTLDALQSNDIQLTSNIKFVFDGEEEAGSPNIRSYLEQYSDKLDGDLWLFLDGPKHQSGRPQVVFGVRGVTGMELTVYGASRSLHSGHYGGWVPVPGQILANLLSTMKNDRGQVIIDRFYESTASVTEADKRAFLTLPDYDDQIKKELGLKVTEHVDRSLIESYMYPTLTVKGLESGNVGRKARNIIPSEAIANLGIRLAKGNDPEKMKDLVEQHIKKQGFFIVRDTPDLETRLSHDKIVKITREEGYPAVRTAIDHPMSQKIVRAVEQAGNGEVILYPTFGGSLPLFHFTEVTNLPIVIVPIANHDNNQHAPDENIRIGNIWYGMEIYSMIFTMD